MTAARASWHDAATDDFEKLGAFYLGRVHDLLLYDAKDLTTHAVCVGMTGSGKTGLGVTLLEEAAIDGIPAIAIDPKGDLGNLALTFPELRPADLRPWIDESAAADKQRTPDEHAADTAELWRQGLGQWGQDGARIARFRDAVEVALYTPGSSSGRPLAVLDSFAAPAPAVRDDGDALRERVMGAVSGLLALVGTGTIHHASASLDLDEWRDVTLLAPLDDDADAPWDTARTLAGDPPALTDAPRDGAAFGELPACGCPTAWAPTASPSRPSPPDPAAPRPIRPAAEAWRHGSGPAARRLTLSLADTPCRRTPCPRCCPPSRAPCARASPPGR